MIWHFPVHCLKLHRIWRCATVPHSLNNSIPSPQGKKLSLTQASCRNSAKAWNTADKRCFPFQRQGFTCHLVIRIFFPVRSSSSWLSPLTHISRRGSQFLIQKTTTWNQLQKGLGSCRCALHTHSVLLKYRFCWIIYIFKYIFHISCVRPRNWRGEAKGCPSTSYKQSKENTSSSGRASGALTISSVQLSEWSRHKHCHADSPTSSWIWGQEHPPPKPLSGTAGKGSHTSPLQYLNLHPETRGDWDEFRCRDSCLWNELATHLSLHTIASISQRKAEGCNLHTEDNYQITLLLQPAATVTQKTTKASSFLVIFTLTDKSRLFLYLLSNSRPLIPNQVIWSCSPLSILPGCSQKVCSTW